MKHHGISRVECDLHGRQEIVHKLMRHLINEERDTAQQNIILKERSIDHYWNFLYTPSINEEMKDNEEIEVNLI